MCVVQDCRESIAAAARTHWPANASLISKRSIWFKRAGFKSAARVNHTHELVKAVEGEHLVYREA